jgi:amino-acid N-acetyltransferase
MLAILLRPAMAADLPAVHNLLERVGLPVEGLEDQFGEAYALAYVGGPAGGDELVGVAGVEIYGHFGLLRSVAVAPSWRGRGVGDMLARNRIDWARARRLDALYLLTTTAAGYFPKLGFTSVPRSEVPAELRASTEFAAACPASAAVLLLPLTSTERS